MRHHSYVTCVLYGKIESGLCPEAVSCCAKSRYSTLFQGCNDFVNRIRPTLSAMFGHPCWPVKCSTTHNFIRERIATQNVRDDGLETISGEIIRQQL